MEDALKAIQLERYGAPEDVARCVEVADTGPAGSGEVVFEVLAFPINPADVMTCRGNYRIRLTFPARLGAECVGRVAEVGPDVTHVKPGDLVINLARENWAQKRKVRADEVIRLPGDIELRQAAMVRINPPTAHLMLTDFVDLKPGDWLMQNVANSAVGRLVITLANARNLRTVNVTRRADVHEDLKTAGATICLLDGEDLQSRVQDAVGGAPIRLALDAVGGLATKRLGSCVEDGGIVVNYGRMSEDDPVFGISDLIFRGVTLTGFMLGRALARRSRAEVQALYDALVMEVMSGRLSAPVDKVYPIESIREALIHAQTPGHHGKVLVAPNGMI